jgi:hypothetical protein
MSWHCDLCPGLSARFGLGILEARAECPREAFWHRLVEESLSQYRVGQSACAWAGSVRQLRAIASDQLRPCVSSPPA